MSLNDAPNIEKDTIRRYVKHISEIPVCEKGKSDCYYRKRHFKAVMYLESVVRTLLPKVFFLSDTSVVDCIKAQNSDERLMENCRFLLCTFEHLPSQQTRPLWAHEGSEK